MEDEQDCKYTGFEQNDTRSSESADVHRTRLHSAKIKPAAGFVRGELADLKEHSGFHTGLDGPGSISFVQKGRIS